MKGLTKKDLDLMEPEERRDKIDVWMKKNKVKRIVGAKVEDYYGTWRRKGG
jgi:hypothetical protein